MTRIRATLLFAALCFFFTIDATATPNIIKIASLAPEGSIWVDVFKHFADEVEEKTDGALQFRIYPGGIMGDDLAMYRRMRVGQLHGGGFTMTGIADIVPDFRVMAIPFTFKSYDEVDHVSAAILPLLEKRFSEKGLELIALTEVGFVYTFSTKPLSRIEDLQQAKTWTPSNDPLTAEFLKSLNISPITLSIPDVLASLQTGLIDTAFNSLYGSIVLQWFTRAPYVTDQPYGYAYGAFIMNSRVFNALSEEQQVIVRDTADKYFPDLITETRKSNQESRGVLESHGVSFIQTTDEVIKKLEQKRDETITRLKGRAFSVEVYDELKTSLDSYRAK